MLREEEGESGREAKEDAQDDSADKEYFFEAAFCSTEIVAGLTAKSRAQTRVALLEQDGDDEEHRQDDLYPR